MCSVFEKQEQVYNNKVYRNYFLNDHDDVKLKAEKKKIDIHHTCMYIWGVCVGASLSQATISPFLRVPYSFHH